MQVTFPPVPLVANSSQHIHAGLWGHELTKPIHEVLQRLLRAAPLAAVLHEVDGHPANDRIHFHLWGKEICDATVQGRSAIPHQLLRCGNHCANLVIVHLVQCMMPTTLLTNMYCFSQFLRMGGHFLRVVTTAHQLIKDPAYFRWFGFGQSRPGHGERLLCQELIDFTISNHVAASSEMKDGAHKAVSADFTRRAQQCFETLEGPLCGTLSHTCRSPTCCSSRAHAEAKAIDAVNFLLRVIPPIPEIKKWTKLFPVLSFFLTADVGGLLRIAFEKSASSYSYPQGGSDASADASGELTWQQIAGVRLSRCVRFLASEQDRFRIVALAVVIEPLRLLHSRFMALAHRCKSSNKLPGIMDEIDCSRSFIVRVQQYLSTLLRCVNGRSRLVWQWSGQDSALLWMLQEPEQARLMHRLTLSAAAWVERRFSIYLTDFPWQLLRVADPRCADGDKESIVEAFFAAGTCCMPPGWARQMRAVHTPDAVRSPDFRDYLLGCSLCCRMTIAEVEKRH